MDHETPDDPDEIEFDLPSGKVTVTEADLDQIRHAVIDYLRSSSEPMKDTFIEELEGALTWIDDQDVGRINQWLLERRGDELVLVRHPPRGPLMYFFVAGLDKQPDQPWKVTSFHRETVKGR